MKTLVLATLFALAVGCGKEQPHGKNATSTTVNVKAPTVENEVAAMGSTYQEAYELAKKEVTKDNAEDELDTIEHNVNKGM
jgi:hypothetical protein